MLDKVILKHIEDMEKVEAEIDAEIDKVIKSIDVSILVSDDRDEYIREITKDIQDILEQRIEKVVALGKKFAEAIKKDGNIEIPDSDNPTLNKDLVDDKNRD